jgi:hypothetical protein
MRAPPTPGEVEIALHQLLRKYQFTGVGHINVIVVGPAATPAYLINLDLAAAKLLGGVLAPVLGSRAQPSATEWVLFQSDAGAIVKLAN